MTSHTTHSHSTLPILIVGAGASGLTLACDLARHGIRCRVIDKLPTPFNGSRGKGLQPRTLEVFDDLGIVEAVLSAGGAFPLFRGYHGKTPVWERSLAEMMRLPLLIPNPTAPYDLWMIPQWRTEMILRNRLAELGVPVEFGTELTAFTQDIDGVHATLVHHAIPEQLRVAYLIGADGGRSFVRKELKVGFHGEAGTFRSVIADVRAESLARNRWHMWVDPQNPDNRVSLCALPGTDSFQLSAPILADAEAPSDLAALQQLFDERSGGFGAQLTELQWITRYRLNVRMADRFRVGRVFLVGDAAHVHSPFGGQGVNTSIQDAYNLGWKLAAVMRGAPEALLDTYEAERLPIAASVLGLSNTLHRTGYQYARDARASSAQDTNDIYQLKLHYRGSPLSRDERQTSTALTAGDRAPDAPCRCATGVQWRLFDLFRGPHFTALVFGARKSAVAEQINRQLGDRVRAYAVAPSAAVETLDATLISDEQAYIRRGYGIDPSASKEQLVLVRPDGYIALITDQCGITSVQEYLRFSIRRGVEWTAHPE